MQFLSYLQGCWRNGYRSHAVRRPGHQSYAADTFQLIKSVSIFESTGRAGTDVWPSLIELSNFGRTWAGSVVGSRREENIDQTPNATIAQTAGLQDEFFLALQVHHYVLISRRRGTMKSTHSIWNVIFCTVKIFPVQLQFWNGPLFPTHIYVSTQNQKVMLEIKTIKWEGQFAICYLIPRADTIHFCLKYLSWVLSIDQHCCLLVSITSLSAIINVSPYSCRFIRDGWMCFVSLRLAVPKCGFHFS